MEGRRLITAVGALLLIAAGPETPEEQAYREAQNGEIIFKNYPPASLRAGEHGLVGFEVELFSDGRLKSCQVTESSGFPRLDEATCETIVRYARFRTAERKLNARGRLEGAVRWELPEGLVKATPPPPQARQQLARAAADDALICRRSYEAGSIIRRTKLCLTAADWARADENARAKTEKMREARGPMIRN